MLEPYQPKFHEEEHRPSCPLVELSSAGITQVPLPRTIQYAFTTGPPAFDLFIVLVFHGFLLNYTQSFLNIHPRKATEPITILNNQLRRRIDTNIPEYTFHVIWKASNFWKEFGQNYLALIEIDWLAYFTSSLSSCSTSMSFFDSTTHECSISCKQGVRGYPFVLSKVFFFSPNNNRLSTKFQHVSDTQLAYFSKYLAHM